jgi:hypothetical protein
MCVSHRASLYPKRLLLSPAERYPERRRHLQDLAAVLDLSHRHFSDIVLFAGASQQGEDAPLTLPSVSRRA